MNSIERVVNGRDASSTAWFGWLTGAFLVLAFLMMAPAVASAQTRTLKLYNLHTKERAEITFKRNGRYDAGGLKKINHFLRDWRRNEPTKIDTRLLDLVWEAYKASGSRDYIHVVSSYRSPATNSMLRGRSKGVAEKSQHMLGKAMDFYIPDVKLAKLRTIGLKMQGGGVGYYPRSGSPFVHMDVGNVRHWPKMSRKELVAVFPNGNTLHVPSDGKPLPGYQQALASYQARKKSGGAAIALASTGGGSKSGNLLAALFGGGADEEEDVADVESTPAPKPKAVKQAAPQEQVLTAAAETPRNGRITILPPELANPAQLPQQQEEQFAEPVQETPETIIAALPARKIPLPGFAPRPQADVGATQLAMATPDQVPFGASQATAEELIRASESGATPLPEDMPFGVAEATPEELAAGASDAVQPAEVAYGIPVPTWRPDATTASTTRSEPTLMALAAENDANPLATDNMAGLPMPQARPQNDGFSLAALPEKGPALVSETAPGGLYGAGKSTKVASLTGLPAKPETAAPVVKTTRKSDRPDRQDGKPHAKAVVVAAEPQAARWALESSHISSGPAGASAEALAQNVVRMPPAEIYAAGFQSGDAAVDHNRFSGKAVTFIPVARFKKN